MQIFLPILMAVLVAACAGWLVGKRLPPRTLAKAADLPFQDVPATLKRGLSGLKGRPRAVAVAAPDDSDDPDAYPSANVTTC
jgi:hypothetical protein